MNLIFKFSKYFWEKNSYIPLLKDLCNLDVNDLDKFEGCAAKIPEDFLFTNISITDFHNEPDMSNAAVMNYKWTGYIFEVLDYCEGPRK